MLFAQNTVPVICELKVKETLQGEQGVNQLVVKGVVDIEDGNVFSINIQS